MWHLWKLCMMPSKKSWTSHASPAPPPIPSLIRLVDSRKENGIAVEGPCGLTDSYSPHARAKTPRSKIVADRSCDHPIHTISARRSKLTPSHWKSAGLWGPYSFHPLPQRKGQKGTVGKKRGIAGRGPGLPARGTSIKVG